MLTELYDHPLLSLQPILGVFRRVDKKFKDNGDYQLTLHCFKCGVRAPKISDVSDKNKVKEYMTDFFRVWDKLDFIGQLVFHLKHAEFTDCFDSYPGSGKLSVGKEGVRYRVVPFKKHLADAEYLYRIHEVGAIRYEG